MDENNRNFLLAIVLSLGILIAWQYFYAIPQMEKEKARRAQQQAVATKSEPAPGSVPAPATPSAPAASKDTPQATPSATSAPGPQSAPAAAPPGGPGMDRVARLKAEARLTIESPAIKGSIRLAGGRIDDIVLKRYRETVDPNSPNVVLFSPSGTARPFYAEYGWVAAAGQTHKLPTAETVWQVEGNRTLTPQSPVTLVYDNGEGLIFRRIISVDENYMFTVRQEVENTTKTQITLFPYALVSRHGRPPTQNFFILHEGLIGVLGEEGLQEIDYDEAIEKKVLSYKAQGGWLGITDKYWAAVIIPDQKQSYQGRFTGTQAPTAERFQADFLLGGVAIPPGGKAAVESRLFAGAKTVALIDSYGETFGILKFDLLIDWGWFYFITKPLFWLIDFLFRLFGNFGVSILVTTVIIKLLFFPLANKSYVSMSKMKKLQPEMQKIRERFKDDRAQMQKAMMELYQREKVNPMSGCLPILLQIPVFFALYKVLFVTIEMRHAPFFGWIKDLSAPDPTSIFNLFGLLPFDPPSFLQVGVWPIIMGITMWVQMKLNPAQPDPIQQKIFNWMPVFFTFLLAPFPAGLVIYWAWNNFLSIIQQWVIMSRQGVEVNLLENMGLERWFKGKTGTGSKKKS